MGPVRNLKITDCDLKIFEPVRDRGFADDVIAAKAAGLRGAGSVFDFGFEETCDGNDARHEADGPRAVRSQRRGQRGEGNRISGGAHAMPFAAAITINTRKLTSCTE
jgi:hypothetical protein